MSTCYSVLFDTVSIQNYIFQSNKLKENLGASFLVEKVYLSYLEKAIKEIFNETINSLNDWKKNPEKTMIFERPVEIGYIGGGNALLFFQKKNKAEEFIKTFTRNLLIKAPGITTAIALKPFDLDNFTEHRTELDLLLQKNKYSFLPQTVIPQHGITAECTKSGLSMDIWNETKGKYVSCVINAKLKSAKQLHNIIHEKYKKILKEEFCFSDILDDLGGIKNEDSHIAIVHIDGNSMRKRFNSMNSLYKMRSLSIDVDNATQNAFSGLLEHIVDHYTDIMDSLGFDPNSEYEYRRYPKNNKNEKILPIRPIILGGDDITFVCDGKLGLHFSKLFIKNFEKQEVRDKKTLSACAGVAITKTSYPFYRGYILAEELCKNAKKVRHNEGDEGSYIDFHVSSGGFSGTLDQIRSNNYKVAQGCLLYRPYKLDSGESPRSFERLLSNSKQLSQFPNNKIQQLRDVLTLSEESTSQFVHEMKFRNKTLPKLPGLEDIDNLFFQTPHYNEEKPKKITPYSDMIELIAYYPKYAFIQKECSNETIYS